MTNILELYISNQDKLNRALGVSDEESLKLIDLLSTETNEEFKEEIEKGTAHTCEDYDIVGNIINRLNRKVYLDERPSTFILFLLLLNRDKLLESLHSLILFSEVAESLKHMLKKRGGDSSFNFSQN
jgi:hypothetical protein